VAARPLWCADVELQKLFRAFRLAALALTVEIVVLIAMVSDTLF